MILGGIYQNVLVSFLVTRLVTWNVKEEQSLKDNLRNITKCLSSYFESLIEVIQGMVIA